MDKTQPALYFICQKYLLKLETTFGVFNSPKKSQKWQIFLKACAFNKYSEIHKKENMCNFLIDF